MTTPPRRHKTPRQRAEEALGVAQRRVDNLDKQRKRLQGQVNQIVSELEEAKARLDYAKKDPALAPATTRPGTTNPAGDTA